jgi:hypothetical protein
VKKLGAVLFNSETRISNSFVIRLSAGMTKSKTAFLRYALKAMTQSLSFSRAFDDSGKIGHAKLFLRDIQPFPIAASGW